MPARTAILLLLSAAQAVLAREPEEHATAPPPPPKCLELGTRWCNDAAVSDCGHAASGQAWLARFVRSTGSAVKDWRCCSPTCFDSHGTNIVGCTDVCTRGSVLGKIVSECSWIPPPLPPPSPGPMVVVNHTDVFWAGENGYAAIKIPGLITLSPKPVVLAFGEGRYYTCSDWPGVHDLMMKRSTDSGASFGELQTVINVSKQFGAAEGGKAGGMVADITPVWDKQKGTLHVLFSFSPAQYQLPCAPPHKPCEIQGYAYPWAHEQWGMSSTGEREEVQQ